MMDLPSLYPKLEGEGEWGKGRMGKGRGLWKVTCVLLLESLCRRTCWWPELQLWED